MSRRTVMVGAALALIALVALWSALGPGAVNTAHAQAPAEPAAAAELPPAQAQAPAEPAAAAELPPAQVGATYTGSKRCSSCHFKEYMSWKKTGHATGFAKVAAKYYADPECMKCHITAYGVPGGYQGAATPDLLGTTCEACHGPGTKHEEAAKPFTNKKVLSDEEKALVNGAIARKMTNICVTCHVTQASHKDHPPFDKQ